MLLMLVQWSSDDQHVPQRHEFLHRRVREASKISSFFSGPATKRGFGLGPATKEKGTFFTLKTNKQKSS